MLSNNNNSNSNHNEQQTSKWLGTNISIRLERSPDFLYVRSVLHIESDELDNYFGQYNCTITNSRGSDHLIVDLQKMKPTGEFGFGNKSTLNFVHSTSPERKISAVTNRGVSLSLGWNLKNERVID